MRLLVADANLDRLGVAEPVIPIRTDPDLADCSCGVAFYGIVELQGGTTGRALVIDTDLATVQAVSDVLYYDLQDHMPDDRARAYSQAATNSMRAFGEMFPVGSEVTCCQVSDLLPKDAA